MKWIFFDIDGTMLFTSDLHIKAIDNYTTKEFNKKIDLVQARRLLGVPTKPYNEEISQMVFGHKNNWQICVDFQRKYVIRLAKNSNIRKYIIPGTLSILKKLSGNYKLGVVSGNQPQVGREFLKGSGIYSFFKKFFFAKTDIKNRFELVSKIKNFTDKEVAVIDDTPSGVSAAQKLGFLSIGITKGSHSPKELKDAGADFVISDIRELPSILKKMNF